MNKYYLVRFSKKTGKIDTTLETLGSAMLKLWAINNTTATKDSIVFEAETGNIELYVEGKKNDFPTLHKNTNENIEDYCQGILDTFKANI